MKKQDVFFLKETYSHCLIKQKTLVNTRFFNEFFIIFFFVIIFSLLTDNVLGQENSHFWGKYNGTYDAGRNFLSGLSRGEGQVSPHLGAYVYQWKLPLPPGRRGIEPSLSLVYSSQGGRGYLGQGWILTIPHIQRSTKFGLPTYQDSRDTFVYHDENGVVHHLIPVWANNPENPSEIRYRFLREAEFSLVVYNVGSNIWKILKRNGHVLKFGSSTNSAIVKVPGRGTFAWYLDIHEDSFGNYCTYTYKDQMHPKVPSELKYTLHNDIKQPAPVVVSFEWRYNPSKSIVDCRIGNCVYNDDLELRYIDVKVAKDTQGHYDTRKRFDFRKSFQSQDHTKLLTKVSQIAWRGYWPGVPDQIPDIDFSYASSMPLYFDSSNKTVVQIQKQSMEYTPNTFEYSVGNIAEETGEYIVKTRRAMIDMNGDGVKDIVESEGANYDIYFGQVDDFGAYSKSRTPETWQIPSTHFQHMQGNIRTTQQLMHPDVGAKGANVLQDLIDMDGDGRPDWVSMSGVALNNGHGFNPKINWPGGGAHIQSIFYKYDYSDPSDPKKTKREHTDRALVDINGDGLPDIVGKGWSVCLNEGLKEDKLSFAECLEWSAPIGSSIETKVQKEGSTHAYYIVEEMVDINGDALPDLLVQQDETNPWGSNVQVYLNIGDGFSTQAVSWGLKGPLGYAKDKEEENGSIESPKGYRRIEWSEAMLKDYNGDGLTDYMYYNAEHGWRLMLNTGSRFSEAISLGTSNRLAFGYSYSYPHDDGFNYSETSRRLDDINGDSRIDILSGRNTEFLPDPDHSDSPRFSVAVSDYKANFALRTVKNNIGGEVDIVYQPASKTDRSQIPIPINIVREISNHDRITNISHIKSYHYEDGLFETHSIYPFRPKPRYIFPGNKEFRGFRLVRERDHGRNVYKISEYYQDVHKNGLMKSKIIKLEKTESVLISKQIEYTTTNIDGVDNTWGIRPYPLFTWPNLVKYHFCEGQESCTTTGSRYEYASNTGRMIKKTEFGICQESDVSCDTYRKGARETTYHYKQKLDYGRDRWIVALYRQDTNRYLSSTNKQIESALRYYHDYNETSYMNIENGLLTKVFRATSANSADISNRWYNNLGLITKKTDYNSTDPTFTKYEYEPIFNKYISKKVTENIENNYEWDLALGVNKLHRDHNGIERELRHDGFGRLMLEQWRDPSVSGQWNLTKKFEYIQNKIPSYSISVTNIDSDRNLLSSVYRFYNGFGQLLQESSNHDGKKAISRFFEYDNAGRLRKVSEPEFIEPESNAWQYIKNVSWRDFTSYNYDGVDRLTAMKVPCIRDHNEIGRTFYYGPDLSVTMIDETGKKVKTFSNGWGNVSKIIRDPDGIKEESKYVYDSHNLITKVDGPMISDEIIYTRDFLGRVTDVYLLKDDSHWTYRYDSNGNIDISLSPRGREIAYTYDSLQRTLYKTFRIADNPDGQVSYTYDTAPHYGRNRVHTAESDAGLAQYDYDPFGRIVRYEFHSSVSLRDYVMLYTYNDAGDITTITYPDGETYEYTYNPDGTVRSLTHQQSGNVLVEAQYTPRRKQRELKNHNGLTYIFEHNACGWPVRITAGRSSDTGIVFPLIQNRLLIYADNGTLEHVTDKDEGTVSFVYDSLHRLRDWRVNDGEVFESYDFGTSGEAASALLRRVAREDGVYQLKYEHPDLPWATTSIHKLGLGEVWNLQYDSDGMLIRTETQSAKNTFEWNARGLLKQIKSHKGVTSAQPQIASFKHWKYDHLNRPAHVGTQLLSNAKDIIGSHFEISYHSGQSIKHLFFGGRRIALVDSTAGLNYIQTDERRSTRYITNSFGNMVKGQYRYRPYGQEYITSGALTDFRFAGMRSEGYGVLRFPQRLLFLGAYHWASPDPALFRFPGILLKNKANPYAYAGHDPINRMDLTGTQWFRLTALSKSMGLHGYTEDDPESRPPGARPHPKIRVHWEGGGGNGDSDGDRELIYEDENVLIIDDTSPEGGLIVYHKIGQRIYSREYQRPHVIYSTLDAKLNAIETKIKKLEEAFGGKSLENRGATQEGG